MSNDTVYFERLVESARGQAHSKSWRTFQSANAIRARARSNGRQSSKGFTLIEVLLAVVISIGLLGVALYFYQQEAEFRSQVVT